jgi:hypothetical protein
MFVIKLLTSTFYVHIRVHGYLYTVYANIKLYTRIHSIYIHIRLHTSLFDISYQIRELSPGLGLAGGHRQIQLIAGEGVREYDTSLLPAAGARASDDSSV